jgi:hypothetical protein
MQKTKLNNTHTNKWYDERKWAAVIVVVALTLAYLIGSRALFTGSLQQYALTIFLIVLAINRAAHLVIVSIRKAV